MKSFRFLLGLFFAAWGSCGFFSTAAGGATVTGSGVEIASDYQDLNGNKYDYVRITGATAAVTADPGQVARVVFLDADGDIVAAEIAGAGMLTVTMPFSLPAWASPRSCTLLRRFSAMTKAPCASASGRITANSSPP